MISLFKSASELERLEEFRKAAMACYGRALSSTEQNVIEFDEKQAAAFRTDLQSMLKQLGKAPEELEDIQESFQGKLREYRDSTHERIRRLRREVEAAAAALEVFAGNTVANGDDYEKELRRGLRRLDEAAASDRLEEVHAAIQAASGSILASFEHMRAVNQLAIAQLKDEIRLLHQKIHAGRPSPVRERPAKGFSGQDIDTRIDELLRHDTSFCLVVVVLKNLRALTNRHSAAAVEDAVQSLQARLQGMVGGASMLGRWTPNQLVAILDVPPSAAMTISREAGQKLTEPHSFEEAGALRTISFQVAAGAVDHRSGADAAKFRVRLQKLSEALGAGTS